MTFNLKTWTKDDYVDLINYLKESSDERYKNFQQSLIPNVNNLLGVRMPLIQKIAREIVKGNWQEYISFIKKDYYEETMLHGLVIGNAKSDLNEILPFIIDFVPKINNWGICDSFCFSLKITTNYKKEMFDFINQYLYSNNEYDVRFGVVMLMTYYIEEEYIDTLLNIFNSIKHDGYYSKMSVAWALSICFIKQKEKTLDFLNNNSLNEFTYKKTLQKIIESKSVCAEDKLIIKSMQKTN